ncbi:g2664 [Coccomyxa elongata]
MAKWEERSDRWIVEDRKDGSNVNGWHWQEQNKLPWSRQKIDELTKGLAANLDASLGKAEILGVKDLTGEAYLTTRKQNKKFAIFELNIVFDWRGCWQEDGKEVKGEVKVSEYSSIDPEEYSFEVTVAAADSGTTAAANLKAAVQGLEEQIFSRLQQYVAELNKL